MSVELVIFKIDYYFVSWYLDFEFIEIYYYDYIFILDVIFYVKYSEIVLEEIVIMYDKLNEVDLFYLFYIVFDKIEW